MVQAVSPLHLEFCHIRGVRRRLVRKGEFPMRQGDPSNYVFRVRTGGLILLAEQADGSYIATDWIGPNSLCGLEDAVRGVSYRCSCRATAVSEIDCLPADQVRQAIQIHPATALAMTNYLSDRVHFFASHAETLALDGLAERVRRTLRVLAEREVDYGTPVSLSLTQGDLAALAGASRQRVNPVLTALRRAGVVELKDGIIRVVALTAL